MTLERLVLSVNRERVELEVEPGETLLEVLRERLHLTGTKNGCGKGECGTCTILIDGVAKRSCTLPALKASGKAVTTIEGLAGADALHPLQESFIRHGAIQCGYCTPGMILAAKGLLDKNSHPDTEDIKKTMRGNLCRCTGYYSIISAIHEAARILKRAPKFHPEPGPSFVREGEHFSGSLLSTRKRSRRPQAGWCFPEIFKERICFSASCSSPPPPCRDSELGRLEG